TTTAPVLIIDISAAWLLADAAALVAAAAAAAACWAAVWSNGALASAMVSPRLGFNPTAELISCCSWAWLTGGAFLSSSTATLSVRTLPGAASMVLVMLPTALSWVLVVLR